MDESENPIGLMADINERREMPRCIVDVPATLVVLSQGAMIAGHMTELSLSGCHLLLPKALSHARNAAVECTFKIRGVGFRLGGIVEWVGNNLAGVQFNTMSSRGRDDLAEVLCEIELENNTKLLASTTSPAQIPAAAAAVDFPAIETILAEAAARKAVQPGLAAETWNPFAGEGGGSEPKAANLRPGPSRPPTPYPTAASVQERGKGQANASNQAPVAAPAPAAQNPAQIQSATQPPRGRDRRAAHRCGIDTSAVIDLVKAGSRLTGQIVDLSMGGCRIRTTEKFPVGIYTRVETEFQLRGLPFRLGGVIQAIHNRNTVGIRFLDMSQRKKDQVAELIAEIEE